MISHRGRFMRLALFFVAASIVSACGATTKTIYLPGTPVPTAMPTATPPPGSPQLVFQLIIPSATAAIVRRPHYVSPATASVAIQLNGGTVTAQNVGAGDAGCANVSGGIMCTMTVAGAAGANTLAVETFDQPNSGTTSNFAGLHGNVLSSATLAVTLNASTPSTVYSSSLNGVPASILIAPVPGQTNVSGSQTSGFKFTTASGTAQFTVVALDADGNPIVGPGAPAISASNVPSGTTVSAVANSQTMFNVAYTANFLRGNLVFNATQAGSTAAPVSASAVVKGDVALIAVAQMTDVSLYETRTGPEQVTVYNVASRASPQVVTTLALPSCPGGVTQYDANAIFDSSWNIITGYDCGATGALLLYPLNGTYTTAPTVLDSSHGIDLLALSGSTLDAVAGMAVNATAFNFLEYTYTGKSASFAQAAPCASAECFPIMDMVLVGGGVYFNYLYGGILSSNQWSASDLTEFNADGGFGITVDGSGNLWIASTSLPTTVFNLASNGPAIEEFNGLNVGINSAPALNTLPAPLTNPLGLDFDANGNLWVVDLSGLVVGYAPPVAGQFGAPLGQLTISNAVYVRAAH
jgi:hypothetical protein